MAYYDKISEGYEKLYSEEQIKKLRIISEHFKPKELMLDLGAGTCICAKYFKIKTVSVDNSSKMLKRGIGKRVKAEAESLPFKDKSFNSVISLTAFHHFNADKAIKEIKRTVNDNSPIAITLLKKSKNFKILEKKLLKEFNVKEYDCVNDAAFIGRT